MQTVVCVRCRQASFCPRACATRVHLAGHVSQHHLSCARLSSTTDSVAARRTTTGEQSHLPHLHRSHSQPPTGTPPPTTLMLSLHLSLTSSLHNADSTSIRRPFDARSTAYQRSLRSQRRNTPVPAVTLAAVTLDPFTYLGRTAYGRNECRRMVVVQSNCSRMGVERR